MTDLDVRQQFQGGRYVNGATTALTEAQARLGYNYGLIVQRLRALLAPAKARPVWNYVELAHQSNVDAAPSITAAEIKSAAWHSIIAGARGIVYFNSCRRRALSASTSSASSLRYPRPRADQRLHDEDGAGHQRPQRDRVLRRPDRRCGHRPYWRGAYYLIAGSRQTASLSAACTINVIVYTTAEVVDESRSVAVTSNVLTDTFAEKDAVHIYRLVKG